MNGEMVNFQAGDSTAGGYLATPAEPGAGVMVIQEWWGLAPQIKAVCDRLAANGFVALLPHFTERLWGRMNQIGQS